MIALWNTFFNLCIKHFHMSPYLTLQSFDTGLIILSSYITNLTRMEFGLFIKHKVTWVLSQDNIHFLLPHIQCSFYRPTITVYYYQLIKIFRETRVSIAYNPAKAVFPKVSLWNPTLQVWSLILCVNLAGPILDASVKVFWIRFRFKLVDFEKGRLPSGMQVGLIESVGDLNRTEGWPSQARGYFPAVFLQISSATLCLWTWTTYWLLPGRSLMYTCICI